MEGIAKITVCVVEQCLWIRYSTFRLDKLKKIVKVPKVRMANPFSSL